MYICSTMFSLLFLLYIFTHTRTINADTTVFKATHVENILVDTIYNRTYISGLNKIYSRSLDLKSEYQVIVPVTCAKTGTNCNNHIKAMQYNFEGQLYVCGTNNGNPTCWIYERKSLTHQKDSQMNKAFDQCPVRNVPALTLFYRGSLWTGVPKRIFKLRKKDFTYIQDAKNEQQLDDPVFVSNYGISDYVYYFFHEVTDESTRRMVRQSRVARMCYNDNGYPVFADGSFVTLMKAELVCKKQILSTKEYYYYDELESTFVVEFRTKGVSETLVYGIFSTRTEFSVNSAICRYRLSDIDKVMNTSPLHRKKLDRTYIIEDFSAARALLSRRNCGADPPKQEDLTIEATTEATTQQLLSDKIMPYDKEPIYTTSSRLTNLVVDDFHTTSNNPDAGLHVIFAGGENGAIHKIKVNSVAESSAKLVETMQPFQKKGSILTMSLHQDTIYVGGKHGAAVFKVQSCPSYGVCNDCVKDPYCAWSRSKGGCIHIKLLEPTDQMFNLFNETSNECPEVTNDFGCKASIKSAVGREFAILRCEYYATLPSDQKRIHITDWLLNNKKVFGDGKIYLNEDDDKQQLVIQELNVETAGKYECVIQLGDSSNSRKKCNITVKAPATKTTTTKRTPVITKITASSQTGGGINVTNRVTTTKMTPRPPVPKENSPKTYTTIIIVLTLFVVIFFIIIVGLCLFICCCRHNNNETETDGISNGHVSNGHGLFTHFKKNYKINRKDSANKELLKQKNKERVYQPTTIEMAEKTNGQAEPV